MAIVGFNNKNEGGLISSETLNLTRVTTLLSGAAGLVVAISGTVAGGGTDWAGFTQGQRAALVIAAIVAVAVITSADLIARATSTSRASGPLATLPTPKSARLHKAGEDIDGKVVAVRTGAPPGVYFYDPKAGTTTLVALHEVTFQ